MLPGPRVLIVDDDPDMLHLMGIRLTAAGYQVCEADSGESALVKFYEQRPQLVITDLRMGGMDGLALFELLQKEAPALPVIILTAHGTIPDAVSATRQGVFSFLTKPFDGQELLRRTADAIRLYPSVDPDPGTAHWRKDIVTVNLRMEEVLRQALRISTESRTAFLVGPSGSGKSTLAKAIHQAGKRADQPFISLSCTDFPASELEQLLSPSNPVSAFAEAGAGILHLQDIGALSPLAQSRLFQTLFAQMQAKDPLNRLSTLNQNNLPPKTQVIASTPRPLDSAVAEGTFRNDLFYLLSGSIIRIPSLNERSEDIPLLVKHFLSKLRPESNLALAPEALAALLEGRWPGNVRQLKNVLEQVAELSITPIIPEILFRRVMREFEEDALMAFDDARRNFEREYLIHLLQTTNGNVAHAARIAQRNRTEFYKLLARHGLDPAIFKQKFR